MLIASDFFKIEEFMQKEFIPKYIESILGDPVIFAIINKNIKDEIEAKEFIKDLKNLFIAFNKEISTQRVNYWQEKDKNTTIQIVGN